MGDPYLCEIKIVAFDFAPKGWARCNGQLMPINQNQALFALLGTTYGGNGQTTFALPDLRGRTPIHMGEGHNLGESAGEQTHTVTIAELPTHLHAVMASSATGNAPTPAGNLLASPLNQTYRPADAAMVAMHSSSTGNAGGSQPHPNMQPFLALNFCIALLGVFPSKN